MLLDIVLIIAGLIVLILGGEALVRGASTLAAKVGISPLVIGLVVVSAATSAPELAVTLDAVLQGEPDLALGNVVGSNIVNILFILGLSALVMPLIIKRQLVRFDIPVMVGISVLLVAVSLDGTIGLIDGLLLLRRSAGARAANQAVRAMTIDRSRSPQVKPRRTTARTRQLRTE